MAIKPLNIFYQEPDPDRWFKFDRYPRKVVRRLVRGKQRPGGVMMVALNLMKGLDKLGVPYRFNDFAYIKKHPEEIACIIGKPHLLFDRDWKNPVILGAGIFSHPIEHPDIFVKHPNLKKVLVPGNWMRDMFEPYYGDKVIDWPTGIDTELWKPNSAVKYTDFVIYNKIRWEKEYYQRELLNPIIDELTRRSLTYTMIEYGAYSPAILKSTLDNSKAAIFLCEHETQGLAYQQILATNTPVFAWDRGGFWKDPYYYPHKVKYEPVSSVPYWDERCGLKFTDFISFKSQLNLFTERVSAGDFHPRDYILENLTLQKCAERYLKIVNEVSREL